jgi:DNA-binding transcriptional LysR family regulator
MQFGLYSALNLLMSDPSSITTQQLATFVRIVQTGSFSAAALALDVAQPTVSGRIKGLEESVGAPLFTRRGRRIALTERGEAFLPFAQRALNVLDEGVVAARLSDAGFAGRVTLGVSDSSLVDSFLGRAVARFHREHPAVEVIAEMSSCEHLVAALHDGVLKLALLPWPYASPSFDPLKPVLRFRERLQLACSSSHPLARKSGLTLADLATSTAPLLRLWWNQPSRRELDALENLPEPVLEVPIQVARHTLLQGYGVALFARSVISHELDAGSLVLLEVADLPPMFCESALVVHEREQDLPAPVSAFVEVLRQEGSALLAEDPGQRPSGERPRATSPAPMTRASL